MSLDLPVKFAAPSPCKWAASFLLATLFLAVSTFAQRPPQIGYLYPAGGRQGSTFEIIVGGQNLGNASALHVFGDGITAEVIEHRRPLSPRQINTLRERADEARQKVAELRDQQKRRPGPRDIEHFLEIMREQGTTDRELQQLAIDRYNRADTKRQPNAQIAENISLQVTIAPNASIGQRELRILSTDGLSNPMIFHVGQLPEHTEAQPEVPIGWAFGLRPPVETKNYPQPITLPATINGQIRPGEVDTCRFIAKKGQVLVIVVQARALVPYLADAVPGWFQAVVSVHDANNREIAYADDYRFDPDPVLACRIPADGEYTLKIRDSIYRGREDFVYRIHIGELPFITSIFPLGAPVGAKPDIEWRGWNLPPAKPVPDTSTPGLRFLFAQRERFISNPIAFAVGSIPEQLETEPNNSHPQAMPVTLPVVINGRIDQPDDVDTYTFQGRQGDKIVAEVRARRLRSPMDSYLRLTDANGNIIAQNDDHEDKASGWNTHHADSYLSSSLPADGAYYLQITDTQRKGGPDHAYRLRISAPQPDFELRIVPSTINLRPGNTASVTVYALRRDGFDGEITLKLDDAPEGFKLTGGKIPPDKPDIKATLAIPSSAQPGPVSIRVVGLAAISDQELVRPAVPADDLMQAFFYRHLVPAREHIVNVLPRPHARRPQEARR